MPKLASRILCLLAFAATSLAVAPAAQAADQPFSTRFAQTIRGDIRTVGNTSMTCPNSGTCTNGRNGTGGSIDDNDFDMVNVDIDSVGSTFNSSSATVALPAGATVAYAGLYWGADTTAGTNGAAAPTPASNGTVRFNNGSGYTTITASAGDVLTSTPQPTRYRAYKDVTSLMTATGNGTYTVANIQAGTGQDRFAGWSLFIAYVDSTLPVRRVSVWDGLGTVDATHTFSTNIAPFFTPATGAVTTNIGLLSFEGDRGIASETMSFAGSNLTDGQNPANNQFNSTISTNGTLFTAKNPNYANQMGIDVDSYVRTGLLTNLQSSATLSFSSTQDYFMPSALFLVSDEGPSVNTSAPTIGGIARDGQVLTASPGTWLGTPTITFAYQWQRCDVNGLNCVNVPGAVGTTYTLTPADVGSTMRVVVTGINDAGNSAPAPSNPTATVVQEAPANVTPPTISGTTADGQTLTAGNGTWTGTAPLSFAYQWTRCDSAGNNCVDIPGATSGTYVQTASDVGSRLRVRVTASNTAGSAASTSAATTVTVANPPVNTVAPVISGTTQDGSVLGVNLGTWTGTSPLTYTYQWQRCDSAGANCVDVAGATSSTFALTGTDVGSKMRVRVTATNVAGSASVTTVASSTVAAQPPVNTVLPVISGTTTDGSTLSVNQGTWTGTAPITYAYQWQRCDSAGANCVDIAGQTTSSHLLVGADVGQRLRVRATATNVAGLASVNTLTTAVIAAQPPVNTVLPVISGTTTDGSTLSVNQGTWTGTSPITYAYQWQRCDSAGANCVDIAGQTASTHLLVGADVGQRLRVRVTGTNVAGNASVNTLTTAVIAALPPANTTPPVISGTTTDGSTLGVNLGTWTGTSPLTYTYQWQRCDAAGANCVDVVGATSSTFALTGTDAGSTIRVKVTATNVAGAATVTTVASSTVAAQPPVNTVLPVISGTTTDGSTLSVNQGTWTGTTPITYAYQWQRCDSAGANCVDIAGQTTSSHLLVGADVGQRLRVRVTATNVAGNASVDTLPTAVIAAQPPANTVLPQANGTTQDGDTLTAANGTWTGTTPISYAYQWLRCDSAGANCVNIAGATAGNYVLTASDVGHRIRVRVTGTNVAGSAAATSPATALATADPPDNTTPPQVSGTTQDGSTLGVSLGTWDGTAPLTYTYQWERCDAAGANCLDIAGATTSTYQLDDIDVGHTIRIEVTATNVAGNDVATSTPSSLVAPEPPNNTTPPQVTGTTQDGETLGVNLGTWTGTAPLIYTYQWKRCDAAGANCVDVPGATSSTYDLTGDDVGHTIRVEVTATNGAGDDTATSAPSSLTIADPPVNTAPPAVVGSTYDGETLSVDLGDWTGTDPLDYDYQWQRCDSAGANCVDIFGATSNTYDLTPDDVGSTIRVEVTATNSAGDDSATSSPSSVTLPAAVPPNNTIVPNVLGSTQTGDTLTVDLGTWTGTNPLDYDYQWQRCDAAGANCVDISGATDDTYDLTDLDVGHTIRVEVTATNLAGDDTANSTPSALVVPEPPNNTAAPDVLGSTQDGDTLSVDLGTWTGTAPLDYDYQWQRCDAVGANCVDISGATDDTYDLVADDVGHTIRIEVTASNSAGDDTATSTPSSVIVAQPLVNTLVPEIDGEPTNGQTLTADTGTWSGTGPIVYSYQWQLCDADGTDCLDIVGADEQTYDIVPGDVGHVIQVVVTADNGTTPLTATSVPSEIIGLIPPVSVPAGPPTLSGTTVAGDTLTADPGDWNGDQPIVLTYQWQQCDAAGLNCVDIAGATDETYELTNDDVGHTIVVVVTGTNDGGSDSAASAPSAVVTGVPAPDPDPTPTPTPTPSPTSTPAPADPQPEPESGVLDDSAQLDDLGATVPGNLIAETSCQQLAGNSKYRRIKLAGIGTIRLRAYTSGPAMKLTPMQVTTQITGGKAKSVKYTLDGKALKAKKGPLYKAAVTPAQLQRIGSHSLKAMVKGKKGAPKQVVLTLSTVPCKTLFTAQRWKTTAGVGLRLRVDARTALETVSFKVPAGLLPKQTTKVRKVGFVRFFVAGGARQRFNLTLPKKGTKAALLAGGGKPSITYGAGGLEISNVPANAAVAELTLYRENKLDKATKPKVMRLGAKVQRIGSGPESFSAKPKAPR
jgi:uncharacterized protein YukE